MPAMPLIGPLAAPELHVMTFNIRRRMPKVGDRSPDRWNSRRLAVRKLLRAEQPTIVGIQEMLFEQAVWVGASLGPKYKRIGRGRNADGRGEGCPLFFDSRRLTLEKWQQLALSSTPEEPGSHDWGNRTPRYVISAIFTDKATGARFHALNTHFDNSSRTSREKSATMVEQLIAAAELPAFITGDFNTSVDTETYRQMTEPLQDTWFAAERKVTENWGSFPNYRAPKLERKRIDWILATRDIVVDAAAINPRRYAGIAASDHLPVQAVLRMPTR